MTILKFFITAVIVLGSIGAHAETIVPGLKPSGNDNLDTALNRLYQIYHIEKCQSIFESYEYIAPLLTEAISEDPHLVTDYIMKIPLRFPISELHLLNLYEYQIAKIQAYEKVMEEKEGRDLKITPLEQHEYALNDATFRMIVKGESVPRDILTFSYDQLADGKIERSVRWVSNYQGMYEGEMIWLLRKKVFADWSIQELPFGGYIVTVVDSKNNETLSLELQKKVVEAGKPAQWTLTDAKQGFEFWDYFTGFCDDPQYF
jgi:hypothetical protein